MTPVCHLCRLRINNFEQMFYFFSTTKLKTFKKSSVKKLLAKKERIVLRDRIFNVN